MTLVGTAAWANYATYVPESGSANCATCGGSGSLVSELITGTNFGFAVPTTATILGIELSYYGYKSGSEAVVDDYVQLIYSGAFSGTNQSAGAAWGTSYGQRTYGGNGNLLGYTGITPAIINNAAFGFGVAVSISGAGGVTVYANDFQVTVWYQTATAILNAFWFG